MLILFLLPAFAFSQSQYKYCLSGGFYSECITLLDSNKFVYESTGDVGNAVNISHGSYTLSATKLVLRFDGDTSEQYRGHVQSKNSPAHSDDACRIELTAIDQLTKEPLPGAAVKIFNHDGKVLTKAAADAAGHIVLNAPRTQGECNLIVSYVAYSPVITPLSPGNDYEMIIYMAPAYTGMPAGQVMTYKIKRNKKDFELRRRGQERFEKIEIRRY